MQSQYCNLQECVSDPKELCSVDLSKKTFTSYLRPV